MAKEKPIKDIVITTKVRGKDGRFKKATTIKLTDLAKRYEKQSLFLEKINDKPTKLQKFFKTRKYVTYLELEAFQKGRIQAFGEIIGILKND